MAQMGRALPVPPEDLNLIPSFHIAAYDSVTPVVGSLLLTSSFFGHKTEREYTDIWADKTTVHM